jgi:hypothetical protein
MRDPDRDRPAAPPLRAAAAVVITDARSAASAELDARVRRYTITMGIRVACFVAMIFVDGWLRWVLLGCAVLLPYIAVVLANQSDQRSRRTPVEPGAPAGAASLTTGDQLRYDPAEGSIVEGSVVEDSGVVDGAQQRGRPEGRVA